MRTIILITAAAGTALAVAAPASAQYRPVYQPQYQPQYQQVPQGYAYGRNNYNQTRAMQARINGIQRQVNQLRARRLITRNEASGLQRESRNLEYRLRNSARYGLNPNEARDIEYRIAKLERHVVHEMRDGRGRNGYDINRNGYKDRDHDGRIDRYEDDRGTRHDPR